MQSHDDETSEKYACDGCRSKKVTCSRERLECKRCRISGVKCTYSRSGVIRRRRKRKNGTPLSSQCDADARVNGPPPTISKGSSSGGGGGGVQSHLAPDIEATRDRLNGLDIPEQHGSLEALSSLAEACEAAGFRHEAWKLDATEKHYFRCEEHALEWAKVFEDFLGKSKPLFGAAPADVMNHLTGARPHQVRHRAWLVMYYSIVLGTVTSASLKEKLQHNLCLALSDVRVLLEPSEANMQALVLVLTTMSEFTGPSLCWMLASNACRMLQALGVNQPYLDRQTRERRRVSFWHLNLLDKALALIFGRTPTFHRAETRNVGLPTLQQIQPFRSHRTATAAPGFFGAHYMYQKILLSHLMDDIWQCVHGDAKPNVHSIELANQGLASWYEQTRKILEAAALSEKPFCDAKNAKSIDVALRTMDFHFLYLALLLAHSSRDMQRQCLDASQRMLHLLQHMSPECKEPYHPMVWQLVCCPFTPFLILFRDIVCDAGCSHEEKRNALDAMEQLPGYLKAMGSRVTLAARLEGVAGILAQQARSIICRSFPCPGADASATQSACLNPWPWASRRTSDVDVFHSGSLYGPIGSTSPVITQPGTADFEADLVAMLGNCFDGDGMLDWLSWDSLAQ